MEKKHARRDHFIKMCDWVYNNKIDNCNIAIKESHTIDTAIF